MCRGCETVHYSAICNPEFQKEYWKEDGESMHKIQCARLVEMRARYIYQEGDRETDGEVWSNLGN